MYAGRRVVVVTPAGRRRYLEILRRYVEHSPLVDAWHLWVNTTDEEDLGYLSSMTRIRKSTFTVRVNAGDPSLSVNNICNFYPHAASRDTVYVRLDDDVVWLASNFFEALLKRRWKEDDLLTSASVINNPLPDWLRQRSGCIPSQLRLGADLAIRQNVGWLSQESAELIHRQLLAELESHKYPNHWQTQDWRCLGNERFGSNAFAWLGEDMSDAVNTMGGVGVDEEHWLTQIWPLKTGRFNAICGSALCSHFAYAPQRKHLEEVGLLKRYAKIAENTFARKAS